MARLFVQCWTFYNNENLPDGITFWQSRFTILQKLTKPSKVAWIYSSRFCISDNWSYLLILLVIGKEVHFHAKETFAILVYLHTVGLESMILHVMTWKAAKFRPMLSHWISGVRGHSFQHFFFSIWLLLFAGLGMCTAIKAIKANEESFNHLTAASTTQPTTVIHCLCRIPRESERATYTL